MNFFAITEFFVGLDKIESLQSHENNVIYQKAFNIVENYFNVDDEDTKLLPQVGCCNLA